MEYAWAATVSSLTMTLLCAVIQGDRDYRYTSQLLSFITIANSHFDVSSSH